MSSKAAQNHKICSNKITEGLIKTKFSVITKNQNDSMKEPDLFITSFGY